MHRKEALGEHTVGLVNGGTTESLELEKQLATDFEESRGRVHCELRRTPQGCGMTCGCDSQMPDDLIGLGGTNNKCGLMLISQG